MLIIGFGAYFTAQLFIRRFTRRVTNEVDMLRNGIASHDNKDRRLSSSNYNIAEFKVIASDASRSFRHLERVHEELRKVEKQNNTLLDNIQTQVWYLIDDHTYGAVNKAHAEFNGMNPKDMAFKDMYSLFEKDFVDVRRKHNQEVFSSGEASSIEIWTPHASGDKRLLLVFKSPKLDDSGKVEYVVCSAEDITERKLAEERVRETLAETERVNRLMEGREDRLIELKTEVNDLLFESGKKPKYKSALKYE